MRQAPAAPAERMPDGFEPAVGPPTPECVGGWVRPGREDPLVRQALQVIKRQMGVKGLWSLQEVRYFEGPEAPPSEKGYLITIKRWYVKGHLRGDPSFRGRWLVEQREFGAGIAAVAPYGSAGFASPDWWGFQWSPTVEPEAFEGLPGEWRGEPYDFVKGGAGLDFPGLPAEVRGCLADT